MVGWHHRLNGHEFEQIQGDSRGQGSLACCSPRGHKKSDTTEQLNNNNIRRQASDSGLLILHRNIRQDGEFCHLLPILQLWNYKSIPGLLD